KMMRRLLLSRSWCTIWAVSANISPPRTSTTAAARGSWPSARPASSSSGRRICGGRVATTYQPCSSGAFAAVERPAPDMPVTMRTSPRVSVASLTCARLSVRGAATRDASPLREIRVDRARELGADARQLLDLLDRGLPERGDGSEVPQQRADPRVAEARHLGEDRADVALAALALVRDREAVRLVAQALHEVERLRRARQDHGIVVVGQPQLFEALGDA